MSRLVGTTLQYMPLGGVGYCSSVDLACYPLTLSPLLVFCVLPRFYSPVVSPPSACTRSLAISTLSLILSLSRCPALPLSDSSHALALVSTLSLSSFSHSSHSLSHSLSRSLTLPPALALKYLLFSPSLTHSLTVSFAHCPGPHRLRRVFPLPPAISYPGILLRLGRINLAPKLYAASPSHQDQTLCQVSHTPPTTSS